MVSLQVDQQHAPERAGRLAVPVATVASAILGVASFGWSFRIHSALPALAFGPIALVAVPAVVPALLSRNALSRMHREMVAPAIASFLSYLSAIGLCFMAWSLGFRI
jgi:hypothetical protein